MPAIRDVVKPRRNPIVLAREWDARLADGTCASRADLARALGVSHARVTQVLKLLNLPSHALEAIAQLGDPVPHQLVTERLLRKIVRLPEADLERHPNSAVRASLAGATIGGACGAPGSNLTSGSPHHCVPTSGLLRRPQTIVARPAAPGFHAPMVSPRDMHNLTVIHGQLASAASANLRQLVCRWGKLTFHVPKVGIPRFDGRRAWRHAR